MIKKIILNNSAKPNEKLELNLSPITIFVGPNNSGKSLLLREIEQYCQSGDFQSKKVLSTVEIDSFTDNQIDESVKSLEMPPNSGEVIQANHTKYGKFNSTRGLMVFNTQTGTLNTWRKNTGSISNFFSHYISMFMSRFGGKERFTLVNNASSGDLKTHPNSNIMALFQDNNKRKLVRSITHEAFQKYFVIDPTAMGQLQIRFSDSEPTSDPIEKGWDNPSVEFHRKATPIAQLSDGVQAFTGLVMATLVGEEKILLIDEPEAFLHPSLSNLLGRKLADIMHSREGKLLVSTHSPNFVMGCIQSGRPTTIVRLTYDGANGTSRVLSADQVSLLFRHPLLRSTGVIQSLFYSSVIVTEGDADRAFYNEINERLLQFQPSKGISSTFFVNAQNKQTIWDIVKPLREMGIPAAAIVDIDVLKDGGAVFSKILKAINFPEALRDGFANQRASLHELFLKTGKNMKRDGGIKLLSGTEQAAVIEFFSTLSDYGVFVVPNGELESWLMHLKISGHSPAWLISMFDALGDDPSLDKYVKPTEGDVWTFISQIRAWVVKPDRKGISL